LDTIYVHADESCLGNQFRERANPGGAGGLVEAWRDGAWERRDYWLAEPDTTNNRMALRSAIEVLQLLKRPCEVVFVSDSQYLVKGIGEWLPGWKARGWKRKAGPIENLELWQELDRLLKGHRVLPRGGRGHGGPPQNQYANFLATRAAKEGVGSDGLVASNFAEWLASRRAKGEYVGYEDGKPPEVRYRSK
jgi:ribonuclease HI